MNWQAWPCPPQPQSGLRVEARLHHRAWAESGNLTSPKVRGFDTGQLHTSQRDSRRLGRTRPPKTAWGLLDHKGVQRGAAQGELCKAVISPLLNRA